MAFYHGDAHREFIFDNAPVDIDFAATEIVAAEHQAHAIVVAAEKSALGDLVLGATDVGFAIEERIGTAQHLDPLGAVSIHRRIPDPAVAHGVGVGDAAE